MESSQNQEDEATNGSCDEVDLEGYVEVQNNSLLHKNESIPRGTQEHFKNSNTKEEECTTYDDIIKPAGHYLWV